MSTLYGVDMRSFSIRLKEERQGCGLTQKQMAEFLNINLYAYKTYEALATNHREPNLETLIKITKILDVSVDYLLGIKDSIE